MRRIRPVPLCALTLTATLAAGMATAQTSTPTGIPPGELASPERTRVHRESHAPVVPPALPAPAIDSLMDRTVIGSDGVKIGKVTDVILGPDGQAQLIVIRSGGFLGFGGKNIAADLRLAEPQTGSGAIRLRDVTTASVRDMPEFLFDDSMTSLNRSPQTGK